MKLTHPRTLLRRRAAARRGATSGTGAPRVSAAPRSVVVPGAGAAGAHGPVATARQSGAAPSTAVRPAAPRPPAGTRPVPSAPGGRPPSGRPTPVEATPSSRQPANPAAAVVAVPSRGHRLLRRVLIAGISVVTGLIVMVLAGLGYLQWRFSQFDRIDIAKGVLDKVGEPSVTDPPVTLDFQTGDGTGLVTTIVGAVTVPPTTVVDTTIPAAPTTLPTAAVSTIPGEGSGDDDPALAGATDDTVPPADLPTADAPLVDTAGVKALGGAQSYNTLIIGTDSRADVTAEEAKTFGKGLVSGKRSDTIMILRTDPDTGQAAILSFPRDLYVHIAGTSKNDRINSAYARSASALVSTIKDNFGVPITHVVEVDFNGFQSVVGTLGGVYIDFPKASRDVVTGLNQPAGHNLLDAKQAVAYVRSRHYETGENNVWTPDGRGDLGRVVRQQAFIRAVIQRAIDQGARNPLTANALLANATSAIKLDPTFSLGKLGELASNFRSFDPTALQAYTVPGVPVRIDKKAVLRVDKAKAAKVVGKFGRRST